MPEARATHFIAVDLELVGGDEIEELVAALTDSMFALSLDRPVTCLELNEPSDDLAKDLRRVVNSLSRLPLAAREILACCERRVVNVGIQAGVRSRSREFAVSPGLLAELAALRVSLAVTIYADAGDAL